MCEGVVTWLAAFFEAELGFGRVEGVGVDMVAVLISWRSHQQHAVGACSID